jgi:hypothetical protein
VREELPDGVKMDFPSLGQSWRSKRIVIEGLFFAQTIEDQMWENLT